MFARFAVAFGLALFPGIATGQSRGPGLPFITADGVVGSSSIPGRAGSTFYQSEHLTLARFGLAVRLGSRGGLRPVVVLDYAGVWGRGSDLTNCIMAPNGTCRKRYPSFSGAAFGVGLRKALGSLFVVGVTGGVGRYSRSYAPPSLSTTGYHLDAEASVSFGKHAAVVVSVRHIEVEKFQGSRMWYRPITFGLRIQ